MKSRVALVVFIFAIVLLFAVYYFYPKKTSLAPPRSQPISPRIEKAFLNAHFGMSKQGVEKANQAALEATSNRFHAPKAPLKDPTRYHAYEQKTAAFLGYDAKVVYTFFDDKLFAYHILVQDSNAEVLDANLRKYLISEYGQDYAEVDDESALKLVWHFPEKIINYWFFQEEYSVQAAYKGVIGVLFLPIEGLVE